MKIEESANRMITTNEEVFAGVVMRIWPAIKIWRN